MQNTNKIQKDNYKDPHEIKEFSYLKYRESMVVIIYCQGCNNHNRTLKHDENKYKNKAENMKNYLKNELSFLKIHCKPIDDTLDFKKIGSFEIYYKSYNMDSYVLISSKLKTLKWPFEAVVANNIKDYLNPVNLKINLKFEDEELKNMEDLKNPIKLDWISMNNGKNNRLYFTNFDNPNYEVNVNELSEKQEIYKPTSNYSKKKRIFSSIVENKIKSKYLDKDSLFKMTNNFGIHKIRNSDENNEVNFDNIKPGNYLILMNQKNNDSIFKTNSKSIFIDNSYKQNFLKEIDFLVKSKKELRVFIEIIEKEIEILSVTLLNFDNNDFADISEELDIYDENPRADYVVKIFSGIYKKGNYELLIKFVNGIEIRKEITINFNNIKFCINSEEDEEYNEESNQNLKLNNDEQVIIEDENENKEENSSTIKKNSTKNSNKQMSVKEYQNKTNEEEKKENSSKHSSKDNKKVDKKNRIQSGKQRPGERIHSAKSQNNPVKEQEIVEYNEINENKNTIIENRYQEIIKNTDNANIILDVNKKNSLELKIATPNKLLELGKENEYGTIENKNDYTLIELNQNSLKLGNYFRIYIKILNNDISDNLNWVINYKEYVYKISISDIFMNYKSISDFKYFDVGILCLNSDQVFFPFLYPTNNLIELNTGLIEIKKLVKYTNNSKFNITKIFGFDDKPNDNTKDLLINKELSMKLLKSYELNNIYTILNIISINENSISYHKVKTNHKLWKQMYIDLNLDNLVDEEDKDDIEQGDFEEIDFDSKEDENNNNEYENKNDLTFSEDNFEDSNKDIVY